MDVRVTPWTNKGTSFSNPEFWSEVNKTFITIDQTAEIYQGSMLRDEDAPSVGLIWRANPDGPGLDTIHPPKVLLVSPGFGESFLSDTNEYKHTNNKYYKFHDWNEINVERLMNTIIDSTSMKFQSRMFETTINVKIENEIIGLTFAKGGDIEFKDPWLLDSTLLNDLNFEQCNRDMNAIFKQRSSPFYPDLYTSYGSDVYRGVFLDQGGFPPALTPPYYSVRAESIQVIGGFECVFDSWIGTNADIVPASTHEMGYNEAAVIFRSGIAVVKAMYRAVETSAQVQTTTGWNLLSVPLYLSNHEKDSVFPGSITPAFTHEGIHYIIEDSVSFGRGYFIKYAEPKTISFTGAKKVLPDSLTVPFGWRLIGTISESLEVCKIRTIPDSIIISIWELGSNGYVQPTILRPGRGYWINVSQSGTIILLSKENCNSNYLHLSTSIFPPSFPPPPILLSPSDSAAGIGTTVTLQWSNNVIHSDSFRVRWSGDPLFESDFHTSPILSDTTYTVSNLTGCTTYYWLVMGKTESSWILSEPWSFTTTTVPVDTPTLVSPAQGSSNISLPVTFTWNVVSCAQSYTLQIATDQNFTTGLVTHQGISGASYADSSLTNNTSYWWKVRATNSLGDGVYSPVRSFTTVAALPAPTLTGTTVTINGTVHPKLSWTSVSGAVAYRVYRTLCPYPFTCSGPLTPELLYEGTQLSDTDLTIIVVNKLIADNQVTYHVVAVNSSGQTSSPSNTRQYYTALDFKIGRANEPEELPRTTALHDCFPNPFNPLTVIRYQLSEDMHVKLSVFNTLGREVATLIEEFQEAGYKSVEFDATSLPSGVYFYRLVAKAIPLGQAGTFTDMKKMLLAK
ncbi:MAG: T9SS type A sorting domain-containing protein [Ignavibacteriae bacterium]|nr:T9SS type A sorting domain-containing protein [Ignavibacteriota bacterium]